MSAILALSVTDKIEQYGAYAGFAAVLGLAVLSLLYFAQAREVKRLREWAGRAPERAADLQDRVQADATRRVAQPAPRPTTPAAAVPGQPVVPGAAARPAAATPAGQAQGAAAAPAAAAAATAAGAATATPAGPGTPAGQPTTVQPAANGAAPPQPPPGQPLRVPGAATPPPARPGAGASSAAADPEPERGRSVLAIVGAAAAILAVGAVLVFGVFGVGGGGGAPQPAANTIGTPGSTTTSSSGTSTTAKGGTTSSSAKPGSYTVAVLNGTAVPGLARGVANRLTNAKYRIGNVTNAADQRRSATIVEYAPGHLAEALSVAKAIDAGRDAVLPMTPGSRAIAGEQATVVVTVGNDQNQTPQQ